MKYTDTFFKFPIKIYDGYSALTAEKEEDKISEETGEYSPVPVSFTVGVKAIPLDAISGWMDVYTKEHTLEEVDAHGFPHTLVSTEHGDYLCTWKRKYFEEKLNKFVQTLDEATDLEITKD